MDQKMWVFTFSRARVCDLFFPLHQELLGYLIVVQVVA